MHQYIQAIARRAADDLSAHSCSLGDLFWTIQNWYRPSEIGIKILVFLLAAIQTLQQRCDTKHAAFGKLQSNQSRFTWRYDHLWYEFIQLGIIFLEESKLRGLWGMIVFLHAILRISWVGTKAWAEHFYTTRLHDPELQNLGYYAFCLKTNENHHITPRATERNPELRKSP